MTEQATRFPSDVHAKLAAAEEHSFWFRHRNGVIAAMVQRFPPGGPILDIGGGNGFVARHLQQRGFPATVIEPDPTGCEIARQRGVPAECAKFSRSLFSEHSIDAIGLFDVIEHIDDDGALLRDCRQVVRPGGMLYLTVPALPALWSADDDYARHVRRYTRASLDAALRGAGFETVALSYFFAPLVLPLFALRSLPSRLGWRKVATPDKAVSQHQRSAMTDAIQPMLRAELRAIQNGRALPIGTSLIAAALPAG